MGPSRLLHGFVRFETRKAVVIYKELGYGSPMTYSAPTSRTDINGTRRWYVDGELHRQAEPAVEWVDGTREWWLDGERHRPDGPALEWANGDKEWYVKGKAHRIDGPAIERADGSKSWYVNGLNHRTQGPAIEYVDGTKEWWLDGKRHRLDGPAWEDANGNSEWYLNGKLHRVAGPAVEWADESKEWWVNNKEISPPYSHVLTAAFSRGLPIPPGVLQDMLKAMSEANGLQKDQLNQLDSLLNKYWPTHVKKILVTLFSDSNPTIKNIAFSLLGVDGRPENVKDGVCL